MNYNGPKLSIKLFGLSIASAFILIGFFPVISGVPASSIQVIFTEIPGEEITAVNRTQEIEYIIRQMNEPVLGEHIQVLQDFKTRYAYRGDKCNQAAEYIYSIFQKNGLEVEYDLFEHSDYTMKNVVGTKPGVSASDAQVIICGHYDSTSNRAWVDAPGADDNGSGIAAVLAAAEILSDYEFNYTIKFIAFSGEEQGLKGSYHYAGEAFANGDNIIGVINLDMIANNDDDHTTVDIYYSGSDTADSLTNHVISTLSNYSHIIPQTIMVAGPSSQSDHHPFGAFYESVHLMESDFSSHYHTTSDLIDYLNLTYGANVTQIALASVAELAQLNSTDNMPPSHGPGFPLNNGYGQEQPTISLIAQDPSGIDIAGLEMYVNGVQIVPTPIPAPLGYNISYVPALPFSDGQIVNVSVKANDTKGAGFNHSWEFTVDALPPAPPTNFTIYKSSVELDKQGLVMAEGPMAYDQKHVLAPTVIYHDGEYKMWYAGYNNSKYHVCYANSSDGIDWTKQGMVLYHGAFGSPDSMFASMPDVIYDGEYKMWYSGYDGSNWRILYANSSDGISWIKYGTVIEVSSIGQINDMYSFSSSVVKDTEYKMWYSALGSGGYSIIYANSSDGINWIEYPIDITPLGSGVIHGDSTVAYPEVIYANDEYHMWYTRHDSRYVRIMYANSSDGQLWNDHGLAIDVSKVMGDYDYFRTAYCSAMIVGNETKVWYSGYNNANWRIMYANITPESDKTDITLSWTPSSSPDVVRYEIFRESRPSAFGALERATPEYYSAIDTQTPWTMEAAVHLNISVYGPVTATDPPYFYLPEDNIIDISLFIQKPGGEWITLVDGVDFSCEYIPGMAEIFSPEFVTGSTIYATFNYSATRAFQTTGNSITDTGAGEGSSDSYFYVIRAIDKVGHSTRQQLIVGKQATNISTGWNLVCSPLLQETTSLSLTMENLDWEMARTWNTEAEPYWTVHVPGRSANLNTLNVVNDTDGIWVKSAAPGIYVSVGPVHNITYNLKAGWNLVSFPHYDYKALSEALIGIPWDRVEVYDQFAPYLLMEIGSGDLMPGHGFWVHVTSDAVWNAYNY